MKIMGPAIHFPFAIFATLILVIFLHIPKYSQAKIEFCLRGRHQFYAEPEPPPSLELDSWFSNEETVIQQHMRHQSKIAGCPSGILFNKPFRLEAVTTDDEPFCYKESVCDEKWKCHIQKNAIVAEILKIGKPGKDESWIYAEGDRDMEDSGEAPQCQSYAPQFNLKSELDDNHRTKREIAGVIPSDLTSMEQIQREVDDQTKRLFYYLSGVNQVQVNSHLRVVKLFKMSSELVSMICDPQYISPKFLQEIERAFLFLLKEQGFDKMTDLDLESYNQLRQTMEHCASTAKMVKFLGRPCPAGIHVNKLYQIENGNMKSIDYSRGPKTFKWGEYDIVLDGAWSIMSVVHAGCFESFSAKVNLLHKFEVALEQLFQAALYMRWEHPTQLADDLVYDSMFNARVNDTLEIMDSCARFLYLQTPLKVQLNRPIHETFYRRKKRSTSQESYDEAFRQPFSSIENSVETSRETHQPTQSDYARSSEDLDYYFDNPPTFECLKTEEESKNKVKMTQEKQYNHCKGHSKRL